MRNVLLTILVITFLAGCGESIQVKKDDFQNLTTVTMDANHGISDWSGLMLYPNGVVYYRTINTRGIATPATISFEMIAAGNAGSELDSKAFVSVDNQKFNLVLTNRELEKTVVVYDDDKGSKRGAKASAKASKTHKGKLTLTPAIERAIKSGKSVSYRLYLGTNPVTYVLTEGEVVKLKEFLNVKNQ